MKRICCVVGVIVVLALCGPALADPLVEFGPSRTVATSTASQGSYLSPNLVGLSDGSIGMSWLDDIRRVNYARSTDGGNTWSSPTLINDSNSGLRYHPRLYTGRSGKVYAAWQDYRRTGSSDNELYIAHSLDYGATWSPNVAVYDVQSGDQLLGWGNIVAPDGTLHLPWGQDTGRRYDSTAVYMASSTDGGLTFGTTTRVSPDPSDLARATYQSIDVAQDGTINLIYSGTDIESRYHPDPRTYFVKSVDGGATWSAPVLVDPYTGNTGSGGVKTQLVTGDDGTLHAFWTDKRNGDQDIYYARSTDDGTTWSTVQRVNTQSVGDQWNPSVQVVDGKLLVAWDNNADERIHLSASTDGGLTWLPSYAIEAGAAGDRRTPYLLALDGSFYAAWAQQTDSGWDLKFASAAGTAPIPEPDTMVLMAAGMAMLLCRLRYRRRAESS